MDELDEKEQAYGDGYIACHDNKPLSANPYKPDSAQWREWVNGWEHYDADYNPDYYSNKSY